MASEVSFPLSSLYAATKAFLAKISHDVGLEYGRNGIFIQSLVPARVATKMSHKKKPSLFAPGTDEFVRSGIVYLGLNRRPPGYYSHKIQLVWFRFLRICFGSLLEKYKETVMNRWRMIAKDDRMKQERDYFLSVDNVSK